MANPAERTTSVPYWAMIWGHLNNDALANYLPGILPAIAIARHIPLLWLASLVTALTLGQALQPLSGMWSDRIGGRSLVLGGILLAAVSTFGVSYAPTYPLLAASLFLTGLGSTLYHPQALAVTRTLGQGREGVFMSGFLVGGEFGRAIGPLAAGVVVAAVGLTHLWLLSIPLLLTWLWLRAEVPSLARRQGASPKISWRRHAMPATSLLIFGTLRAASVAALVTFLPLIYHAQGGSLVAGASLVTTLIGVGVIGNLAGGAVRDRLGATPVLWGSTIVAVLAALVLTVASGPWLWVVLAALGIGVFSTGPITILLGQDIFTENPALGSGIALGLANGLGALALLPLSYLAQLHGLHAGLWAVVALGALSMLAVPALARVDRQATAA
ncbi:MAG: MFS transporter [Sulfobacillus sp.]